MANVLGSTLGLTAADKTRNPNDLNPDDDKFALMVSNYATAPSPYLGTDDRAALCYLYGDCVGQPAESKIFVPFVGRVAGQSGSIVLVGDGAHEPLDGELDRDHPVHALARNGQGRR